MFVIGYIFIALEHQTGINKTAIALLLGILLWVMLSSTDDIKKVIKATSHNSFFLFFVFTDRVIPSKPW